MTTEASPVEGLQFDAANAMSGRTAYWFLLHGQTWSAGSVTSALTLAAGLVEISGTGYARLPVTLGVAVNGIIAVPSVTFGPSVADWPNDVSACGLASALSGGIAHCVWDLLAGPYDLSLAGSTLQLPVVNFFYENVGGI